MQCFWGLESFSNSFKVRFFLCDICLLIFCVWGLGGFNLLHGDLSMALYGSCLQLRNLVWATSKHDVYLISNDSLMHWSSISCNLSEVLNFSGRIVPTEVIEKYLVMVPYFILLCSYFFFSPLMCDVAWKKLSLVCICLFSTLIYWLCCGVRENYPAPYPTTTQEGKRSLSWNFPF